ncbi:type IV secretory system conjugative DNA transfer family protein [Photorhabdus hainanensis]|uniref:type IV secretory system conjugative DNA transfer family protein n=1 Tax=Photorhabdus hainanensis TaxID=1004166 RepID=UPI001BD43A08|nr:conjugal transfer protein TrbC [Photorhabdus hainanensis]
MTEEIKTPEQRDPIGNFIITPGNLMIFLVITSCLCLIFPALLILFIPITLGWSSAFFSQPERAPLRLPFDADMVDPSLSVETASESRFLWVRYVKKIFRTSPANGRIFIGYSRKDNAGKELWATDEDWLRHVAVLGTTGSGKTEILLGFYLQSVLNGSGNVFIDGKATMALPFAYWSLARRFGREEDVYFVNFITGNLDRFEHIAKQNDPDVITSNPGLVSNTIALFNVATPTLIINLLQSMLPKVGGDSAQWQESAKSYLEALTNALCYKRARGELKLNQQVIREHLSLHNIVNLYNEAIANDWHHEGYSALETYLENLPGFNLQLRNNSELWAKEAFEQHNYRSNQFVKLLNFFSETYSHVFPDDNGDINMQDVLHNGRLLCILIPGTELSETEMQTIGGMFINLLRMSVTKDLGNKIEGDKEVLEYAKNRYFGFPFQLIFDELGQYFSRGLASLFALIRALKYNGIFGTQDLNSMSKVDRNETYSMLGNTRVKCFLAVEDMGETYSTIEKNAGTANVADVSTIKDKGSAFSSASEISDTYQIREKSRVKSNEIKGLKQGEGLISIEDMLVKSRAFYISDNEKLSNTMSLRVNKFISVEKPTVKALTSIFPVLQERKIIQLNEVRTSLTDLWEALEKIHVDYRRNDIEAEIASVLLFEQAFKFFNELDKVDAPCFIEKEDEFELLL